MPEPARLLALLGDWNNATTRRKRKQIWEEMLSIHAEQLFTIGLISGTLQPVVVNTHLKNVPERRALQLGPRRAFRYLRAGHILDGAAGSGHRGTPPMMRQTLVDC